MLNRVQESRPLITAKKPQQQSLTPALSELAIEKDETERELIAVFSKYKRKRDDFDSRATSRLHDTMKAKDQRIQKLDASLRESQQDVKDLEARLDVKIGPKDKKIKELEKKLLATQSKSAKLEADNEKLKAFLDTVTQLSRDLRSTRTAPEYAAEGAQPGQPPIKKEP